MFTTFLVTEKIGPLWRLIEDLTWDGNESITVPAGYLTDLASIPAWLWKPRKLFGIAVWRGWKPWGPWARAATLHDWLYENPEGRSRWAVDWLFFQAMRADSVSLKIAILFWLACVFFGGQWFIGD